MAVSIGVGAVSLFFLGEASGHLALLGDVIDELDLVLIVERVAPAAPIAQIVLDQTGMVDFDVFGGNSAFDDFTFILFVEDELLLVVAVGGGEGLVEGVDGVRLVRNQVHIVRRGHQLRDRRGLHVRIFEVEGAGGSRPDHALDPALADAALFVEEGVAGLGEAHQVRRVRRPHLVAPVQVHPLAHTRVQIALVQLGVVRIRIRRNLAVSTSLHIPGGVVGGGGHGGVEGGGVLGDVLLHGVLLEVGVELHILRRSELAPRQLNIGMDCVGLESLEGELLAGVFLGVLVGAGLGLVAKLLDVLDADVEVALELEVLRLLVLLNAQVPQPQLLLLTNQLQVRHSLELLQVLQSGGLFSVRLDLLIVPCLGLALHRSRP
mmetsp:Transcript_29573/g.28776  ORF Transcript_29573/g.28776 Transcript_29573/m.28776 type:complete len:377 (-) Transcript_29573:416-1546(-)